MNARLISTWADFLRRSLCSAATPCGGAQGRTRLEDVLLLCEHTHVITLGRNGKRENLLVSEHVLRQKVWSFTRPTAAEILLITGRGRSWGTRF